MNLLFDPKTIVFYILFKSTTVWSNDFSNPDLVLWFYFAIQRSLLTYSFNEKSSLLALDL